MVTIATREMHLDGADCSKNHYTSIETLENVVQNKYSNEFCTTIKNYVIT